MISKEFMTVPELKERFPKEMAMIEDANLRMNLVLQNMLHEQYKIQKGNADLTLENMRLGNEVNSLKTQVDFARRDKSDALVLKVQVSELRQEVERLNVERDKLKRKLQKKKT